MEEGRQHAPWLEVRGNHDNFDVKTRGGPQDRARAQFFAFWLFYKGTVWKQKIPMPNIKIVPKLVRYHANPLGIRFLLIFFVSGMQF